MKSRFPVCLVLLGSLLSGCATSYRVKVDSLAKPDANAISYSLRHASSTEEDDALRSQEAANLVRTALSGRGLFEAPAKVVPDVIVEVDYGVTPRVRREKRLPPPWGKSPWEGPVGMGSGPRTETEKLEAEEISITTYEKYLHLTAREKPDATNPGVDPVLWRVDVTSEGDSKDLRQYLPVLVAVSIEYVGKDSRGAKTVRIKDTDADLVFVKKGM